MYAVITSNPGAAALALLAIITALRCQNLKELRIREAIPTRPLFNRYWAREDLLRGWCIQGAILLWVWCLGTFGVMLVAAAGSVWEDEVWTVAKTATYTAVTAFLGTLLEAELYAEGHLTPLLHITLMVFKMCPSVAAFVGLYFQRNAPRVLWTYLVQLGLCMGLTSFLGGVLLTSIITYCSARAWVEEEEKEGDGEVSLV